MQRKFLEALGIAEDVIEKIMAEHGKDIERFKTERDGFKSQLDEATEVMP